MRRPLVFLALLQALTLLAPRAVAQSTTFASQNPRTPVGIPVGIVRTELAANQLSSYPYVEYVRAFHEGATIVAAIDPTRFPFIAGRAADVYVVAAKSDEEWASDRSLVDVHGTPQRVLCGGSDVQENSFLVEWGGRLSGFAGIDVGVGYDVVMDFDRDGRLGPGDVIDGLGPEAGFYVVRDTTLGGPLAVTEAIYSGGVFLGQDLYYPSDVATLGQLPLVVVSHGNGHDFRWYDHIGYHLASYGYVVMSHENDTMPGIETASTTTLTNTDYLLGHLATIEGGALDGHVDSHRITWIGHSRGGEGVVRAYRRLLDQNFVPANFAASDVKLISSICPVTFLTAAEANTGDCAYHFLYTPSDSDVTGSPGANDSKPFALYERARGEKVTNYLHGAGHANFHSGGGFCWCTGPDLIGNQPTRNTMRGYYLPLVKYFIEGNVPSRDFFTRPFLEFHPFGIAPNIVMANDYKPALASPKVFVIDDYQSEPALDRSSSGGLVTSNALELAEGLMRDTDGKYLYASNLPMNGMTRWRDPSDDFSATVFSWNPLSPAFYELEVVPAARDLRGDTWLAFRACQGTRHPETDALDQPLTFTVSLIDGSNHASSIALAQYGSLTRTYERIGFGTGAGWANEFCAFRLRASDFVSNGGSGLDLADVAAVRFDFGAGFGSDRGRIGLDDVQIVKD